MDTNSCAEYCQGVLAIASKSAGEKLAARKCEYAIAGLCLGDRTAGSATTCAEFAPDVKRLAADLCFEQKADGSYNDSAVCVLAAQQDMKGFTAKARGSLGAYCGLAKNTLTPQCKAWAFAEEGSEADAAVVAACTALAISPEPAPGATDAERNKRQLDKAFCSCITGFAKEGMDPAFTKNYSQGATAANICANGLCVDQGFKTAEMRRQQTLGSCQTCVVNIQNQIKANSLSVTAAANVTCGGVSRDADAGGKGDKGAQGGGGGGGKGFRKWAPTIGFGVLILACVVYLFAPKKRTTT
jgi:hypothetical protein